MITFSLPWPSSKLNPNSSKGKHWGSTYDARRDARHIALMLTRHAMTTFDKMPGEVPLTITFVQPDRRARDRDNLLAALKPSLDGVADALGVNDSQFEPVTIRREYGAKPGSVRIEIGAP